MSNRLIEALAIQSPWVDTCRKYVGYSKGWDMSRRANRREARRWRRRLWHARWGRYLASLYGVLGGIAVGIPFAYWMTL